MFDPDAKKSIATYIRAFCYLSYAFFHYHLSLKRKFSRIGGVPVIWGIRNLIVYGPNISIGKNVIIVAADGYRTNLSSLKMGGREGRITIGDNVLIMNGVRVSSASSITIGDGCMLANHCYLTDADWHDIHDRTSAPGGTRPIVLERGAWVGDSAIVCKGVRVGENSIIGAGAVVTRDVPPNAVVAGNPARVVKRLDPRRVILMGEWDKKMKIAMAEAEGRGVPV
jgi:acetyltransferase-like isoleucine patch superfamily enzyme